MKYALRNSAVVVYIQGINYKGIQVDLQCCQLHNVTSLHTKCETIMAQCENFTIFLLLRFYVKSLYGILEVQNLPLCNI